MTFSPFDKIVVVAIISEQASYASGSGICHSNVKFRSIKFDFKYVHTPSWPRMPFGQRIFVTNIHNISRWHLGSKEGGEQGCRNEKKSVSN